MSTMQTPADVLANSYGSQLTLDPQDSVAPVENYITQDMFLSIQHWASVAGISITITARLLLPDGTLKLSQQVLVTTSDRSKQGGTVALTEGFLLSVVVQIASPNVEDRIFVSVRLSKGSIGQATIVQQLCAGYPNINRFVTWPPGVHEGSSETNGYINSVTGTTPGAGSEISETVPSNARWELLSFHYSLTTSATVATRQSALIIDDGTNILWESTQINQQAASLVYGYSFFPGSPQIAAQTVSVIVASPIGIQLLPGFRIRTTTLNLQAGDQYTPPQYLVKEWIHP